MQREYFNRVDECRGGHETRVMERGVLLKRKSIAGQDKHCPMEVIQDTTTAHTSRMREDHRLSSREHNLSSRERIIC